jgi:hypothetical protein
MELNHACCLDSPKVSWCPSLHGHHLTAKDYGFGYLWFLCLVVQCPSVLHCVSCQECWKHCLQLLINAVPLFPRMLWGPTGFLLCLIIDCKTMLLLSVDTWTWLNGTSTGLERGLTYGSELYNSRTSRGHYKEQWQPILLYVMHLVIIHTNGWLAFFLCSSLFVTARSIGNWNKIGSNNVWLLILGCQRCWNF